MNQNIKQLLAKAHLQVMEEHGLPLDTNLVAERFADLIIEECIQNLETHSTCFDGDVGRGIKIAARLTKEHFGVEV